MIPISIYTELGPIVLDLYPDKAPITVNNFLKYLDEDRYKDFHFYRVVNLNNQPENDIKIEDSPDNSSYSDLITFPQATGRTGISMARFRRRCLRP